MNENIIVKSKRKSLTFLIILAALVFVIGIVAVLMGAAELTAIISTLIAIAIAISYFALAGSEMIITDKRVYGRTTFGKQVDIPIDSISSVGSTSMLSSGISVSSSSGKIVFKAIKNRDEMRNALTTLLNQRQNSYTNTMQNDLESITKLKTLLDSGTITQEEFDAKKKEFLGL